MEPTIPEEVIVVPVRLIVAVTVIVKDHFNHVLRASRMYSTLAATAAPLFAKADTLMALNQPNHVGNACQTAARVAIQAALNQRSVVCAKGSAK